MENTFSATLKLPFDEAIEKVRTTLAHYGFGIITEIDVKATLKKKLDTDFKNYSLEEVLKNSDILTIHCPLNDETENLINKDTLGIMKRSAILINTSRGGIINEIDLKEALNSETIAGAGIDVLSREPPKNGNPLLDNVRNIIITPHTAWSTVEARQRMIDITADNIRSFIGGNLKNRVNL